MGRRKVGSLGARSVLNTENLDGSDRITFLTVGDDRERISGENETSNTTSDESTGSSGTESGTRIEGSDASSSQDSVTPSPSYTKAPPLDSDEAPRKRSRSRSTPKRTVVASSKEEVTAEKCEAFLVGVSSAISLALAGNNDLALESNLPSGTKENDTRTEGERLGAAMAECLNSIPNNPVTKVVSVASSWFGFFALLGGVVAKRALMIMMYNAQKQMEEEHRRTNRGRTQSEEPSFNQGAATVVAPEPQEVGHA